MVSRKQEVAGETLLSLAVALRGRDMPPVKFCCECWLQASSGAAAEEWCTYGYPGSSDMLTVADIRLQSFGRVRLMMRAGVHLRPAR